MVKKVKYKVEDFFISDEELKNIAEICKSNIREIDYIGSYGGDKFLFLLQGTYPQNVIA